VESEWRRAKRACGNVGGLAWPCEYYCVVCVWWLRW